MKGTDIHYPEFRKQSIKSSLHYRHLEITTQGNIPLEESFSLSLDAYFKK